MIIAELTFVIVHYSITHYLKPNKIRSAMRTYAFFYLMDEQNKNAVSKTAQKHTAYWKSQNFPNYYGGPFADFSGGLIVFQANDQDQAEKLVSKDPFVVKDLIKDSWVKEWNLRP